MESMRDIDRAMEREIAKGSCPLKFVKIEFGDSPYREIASKEKLSEVLSYLLRTGSYGRFAINGTMSNVYMNIKDRKPAFQRTYSISDWDNVFFSISDYVKKIEPDFDGHTYLETVQCFINCRTASDDMDISGIGFSEKEWGIVILADVRDVLFQCLLLDTVKYEESVLCADLCTIYCLKENNF